MREGGRRDGGREVLLAGPRARAGRADFAEAEAVVEAGGLDEVEVEVLDGFDLGVEERGVRTEEDQRQ